MEIKGKVHCLFEQSGTFKNEFKKLGIDAYDYDIQNHFGQTDFVIDLFGEIEKAWTGEKSIFDDMTKDDFILAFFPCIHFCNIAEFNQRSAQEQWRRKQMPPRRIYELLKKKSDERYFFYQKCLKLFAAAETRGLRFVMENPWGVMNYTNYFFFMRPTLIDTDRTKRGDKFKKPTAYWFLNCSPTNGMSLQQTPTKDIEAVGIGLWKKHPGVPGKHYARGGGAKRALFRGAVDD